MFRIATVPTCSLRVERQRCPVNNPRNATRDRSRRYFHRVILITGVCGVAD